MRSHARSSETLRLRRKSLRPQDPRIGFITLRRTEYFPQEKCPNLDRLWKSMEARESMKKARRAGVEDQGEGMWDEGKNC